MHDTLFYLLTFEFVRFLIAGGTVTTIYFTIYLWLVESKKIDYSKASWIAFFPAFTTNFILQKFWAFRSDDVGSGTWQFVLFAIKYFLIQKTNILLLHYFVKRWELTPRWAQISTTAILTVISYIISHFIFAT